MKMRWILTIALLALATLSCEREMIVPENDAPEAHFSTGCHIRPSLQCGSAAHANFTDNLGSIEILNDSANVYILTDMALGWQMTEIRIFIGDQRDMPSGLQGVDLDAFPYADIMSNPVDLNTVMIPHHGMQDDMHIAIYAVADQVSLTGQRLDTRELWIDGTPYLNAYFFDYAKGSCGDSTI